ncbi:hypothetical protein IH981_02275, partial [Patescibacteria group bacterium]|nr:hypothetical protein [Patescibacteria group bacterium]
MRLFKKALIVLSACSFLFILALFIGPQNAHARHVCANWGINKGGDSSYPGGLIVKTQNTSGSVINGITFTLSATHASLVQTNASGQLFSNTS